MSPQLQVHRSAAAPRTAAGVIAVVPTTAGMIRPPAPEKVPIPGSGCEKARGPAAQGRMFRRLLNDGDRLPTSAGKERACEAALRTGSGNAGFCAMYRDGIAPGSDGRSSRDLEGHTRRRPAFPAILPS